MHPVGPIGQVTVAVGSFDAQRMQNPDIGGIEYQQGELEGYLLREYLLEKFERRCVYCGAQEVPLEIDHVLPKARGGANRVTKWTKACPPWKQRKRYEIPAELGFPDL